MKKFLFAILLLSGFGIGYGVRGLVEHSNALPTSIEITNDFCIIKDSSIYVDIKKTSSCHYEVKALLKSEVAGNSSPNTGSTK
jgi:hypothetical protein